MHYEIGYIYFFKAGCLIKAVKKVLFDKAKCLTITYKSSGLSCKLLKMTKYYIKENSLFELPP